MRPSLTLTIALAILASTALIIATPAHAGQLSVLHNFAGNFKDGASSRAGLIFDASGNLYGTTQSGGVNGYGTVFELLPKPGGGWTERILYSFKNNNNTDGFIPYAGLVFDTLGNLYGTTFAGGAYGYGTVFELAPRTSGTWGERILYSFNNSTADGVDPTAGLVLDASGNLYGTTSAGGQYGFGTAFELVRNKTGGTWKEKVLHNFNEDGTDGGLLYAGLTIDAHGNLYGVTFEGGTYNYGIAFQLSPGAGGEWTETILHHFNFNGSDGGNPNGLLLLDASGNLYGTTEAGGIYGPGTVFELTPQAGVWSETILYNFGATSTDGNEPQAGLVMDALGNLYGTTYTGFGFTQIGGTVFELSQSGGQWIETLLYGFSQHGITPWGPRAPVVLDATGNLYGTTYLGGAFTFGAVYEIKR